MPTAPTGPPAASAACATSSTAVGHGGGVELDQTGERGGGRVRAVVDVFDGRIGVARSAARSPLVPTSMTRMDDVLIGNG